MLSREEKMGLMLATACSETKGAAVSNYPIFKEIYEDAFSKTKKSLEAFLTANAFNSIRKCRFLYELNLIINKTKTQQFYQKLCSTWDSIISFKTLVESGSGDSEEAADLIVSIRNNRGFLNQSYKICTLITSAIVSWGKTSQSNFNFLMRLDFLKKVKETLDLGYDNVATAGGTRHFTDRDIDDIFATGSETPGGRDVSNDYDGGPDGSYYSNKAMNSLMTRRIHELNEQPPSQTPAASLFGLATSSSAPHDGVNNARNSTGSNKYLNRNNLIKDDTQRELINLQQNIDLNGAIGFSETDLNTGLCKEDINSMIIFNEHQKKGAESLKQLENRVLNYNNLVNQQQVHNDSDHNKFNHANKHPHRIHSNGIVDDIDDLNYMPGMDYPQNDTQIPETPANSQQEGHANNNNIGGAPFNLNPLNVPITSAAKLATYAMPNNDRGNLRTITGNIDNIFNHNPGAPAPRPKKQSHFQLFTKEVLQHSAEAIRNDRANKFNKNKGYIPSNSLAKFINAQAGSNGQNVQQPVNSNGTDSQVINRGTADYYLNSQSIINPNISNSCPAGIPGKHTHINNTGLENTPLPRRNGNISDSCPSIMRPPPPPQLLPKIQQPKLQPASTGPKSKKTPKKPKAAMKKATPKAGKTGIKFMSIKC